MAGYPISRYAHERITKEVVEATYKATKKVFYESGHAAGKEDGIREGMRREAEIMRGRKVLASDFYYELLLKEIGE